MSKAKKSIYEHVREAMPEFVDEVANLDVDALDSRLAQAAKDLEQVDDAKEADEELQAAKAHAATCSAPYREAKKTIKLKTRYLISLVKERGTNVK